MILPNKMYYYKNTTNAHLFDYTIPHIHAGEIIIDDLLQVMGPAVFDAGVFLHNDPATVELQCMPDSDDYTFFFPKNTGTSGDALITNGLGETQWATIGYIGGTVTSIGVSTEDWLTVTDSPVTSFGTIHIAATHGTTGSDRVVLCHAPTFTGTAKFEFIEVTDASEFTGDVSIEGLLDLAGDATFAAAVQIYGTLSVLLNTQLNGGLEVGGDCVITGLFSTIGDAIIGLNLTVDGTAEITGAVLLGGAFSVTGDSNFFGLATFGGITEVTGDFTTSGLATFTGLTTHAGTTNFTGNTEFVGNVLISGNFSSTGNFSTLGTVEMNGDVNISGALTASGASVFTGAVNIGPGVLTVEGEFNLGPGALTTTGAANFTGAVNIGPGTLTVEGVAEFTGEVNIGPGLTTVEGDINLTGLLSTEGDIAVVGAVEATVSMTAPIGAFADLIAEDVANASAAASANTLAGTANSAAAAAQTTATAAQTTATSAQSTATAAGTAAAAAQSTATAAGTAAAAAQTTATAAGTAAATANTLATAAQVTASAAGAAAGVANGLAVAAQSTATAAGAAAAAAGSAAAAADAAAVAAQASADAVAAALAADIAAQVITDGIQSADINGLHHIFDVGVLTIYGGTGLTTIGSNKQCLTSTGTALTYTNPIDNNNIVITVPSWLSISNANPILHDTTVAITGTATGTGTTTVLNISPTLTSATQITEAVLHTNTATGTGAFTIESSFAPNITAGSTTTVQKLLGVSGSSNNAAILQFNYNTASSNTNSYGIGLYGANNLYKFSGVNFTSTLPIVGTSATFSTTLGVTGTSTLGIVNMSGTALFTNNTAATFLDSTLTTSGNNNIRIGRDTSGMNTSIVQFNYVGAASTSNNLAIGFFGSNNLYQFSGVQATFNKPLVLNNGSFTTTISTAATSNSTFKLPADAGTTGYLLTSAGASGTMTWSSPSGLGLGTVTSVGLTMPSLFTVTSSPITSSGTIAVTLAGTSTGTGNNIVLDTSPTITSSSTTVPALILSNTSTATCVMQNNFAPNLVSGQSVSRNFGFSSTTCFLDRYLYNSTTTGQKYSMLLAVSGAAAVTMSMQVGSMQYSIPEAIPSGNYFWWQNSLMNTGTNLTIMYGRSETNYNSAHLKFNYIGSGSTSNSYTIGFFGFEDLYTFSGANFTSTLPIVLNNGSFTTTISSGATSNSTFKLPVDAGTTGYLLTSAGPSGTMTWSAPSGLGLGTVTSVGMTVPSILSVTPSTITTSGTFAVTTASTPSGTGTVLLLQGSPTITTPTITTSMSITSAAGPCFTTHNSTLADAGTVSYTLGKSNSTNNAVYLTFVKVTDGNAANYFKIDFFGANDLYKFGTNFCTISTATTFTKLITQTLATTGNAQTALNSSLTAGQTLGYKIGLSDTTGNSALLQYTHQSSNGATNSLYLGFTGSAGGSITIPNSSAGITAINSNSLTVLNSAMTLGGISTGTAASAGNTAELLFNYTASNSTSNWASVGFWNTRTFKIFNDPSGISQLLQGTLSIEYSAASTSGGFVTLQTGTGQSAGNMAQFYFENRGNNSTSNVIHVGFYGGGGGQLSIPNDANGTISTIAANLNVLAGGLSIPGDTHLRIGVAASTGNCGEVAFHSAGSNSSSNNVSLGFYGTQSFTIYNDTATNAVLNTGLEHVVRTEMYLLGPSNLTITTGAAVPMTAMSVYQANGNNLLSYNSSTGAWTNSTGRLVVVTVSYYFIIAGVFAGGLCTGYIQKNYSINAKLGVSRVPSPNEYCSGTATFYLDNGDNFQIIAFGASGTGINILGYGVGGGPGTQDGAKVTYVIH